MNKNISQISTPKMTQYEHTLIIHRAHNATAKTQSFPVMTHSGFGYVPTDHYTNLSSKSYKITAGIFLRQMHIHSNLLSS